MRRLRNETDLALFREEYLTPVAILQALDRLEGRVLINVPAGIGKSYLADQLLESEAVRTRYNLIIYLAGRKAVLDERPTVQRARGLTREEREAEGIVLLEGRPRDRCGPLDEQWRRMERARAGELGRAQLCGRCPAGETCSWPEQYMKERLAVARLVVATQDVFLKLPDLLPGIREATGADKILVVIDEDRVLDVPYTSTVSREQLTTWTEVLKGSLQQPWPATAQETLRLHLRASEQVLSGNVDEQDPLPRFSPSMARKVQALGLESSNGRFRHLAYDLRAWAASETDERWYEERKGYCLLRRPWFPDSDIVLLAADVSPNLVDVRLRERFRVGHPEVTAIHEETRIYRIGGLHGTRRYFAGNLNKMADLTVGLISQGMREGRRSLIITFKDRKEEVAERLRERARKFFGVDITVWTERFEEMPADPAHVALIHFGVEGVNMFTDFGAVVTMGAFVTDVKHVDRLLRDSDAPVRQVGARTLRGADGTLRVYPASVDRDVREFQPWVDAAVDSLQGAVVRQAIGRVRHTTKPRLVLVMAPAPIPGLPEDKVFEDLGEAMAFLDVNVGRRERALAVRREVERLSRENLGTGEIAARLGLTRRRVQQILAGGKQAK